MPHFAILRHVEPTMTREDVDAGAILTLMHMGMSRHDRDACGPGPAIEWVRSYWQQGGTWGMCLYSAPSAADIVEFHQRCEVEYVSFSPVAELSSPRLVEPATGKTALDADLVEFVIEAPSTGASGEPGLFEDAARFIGGALGARLEGSVQEIRWIRTYWDEANQRAVALYAAPSRETIAALQASCAGTGVPVRPVIEIYPDEYLDE